MNATNVVRGVGALALISLCAACSTWNGMSRNEKSTTTGAVTGGVVGAAVGGPVGAAVGAGVGGYVGHEGGPGAPNATASASDHRSTASATARSSPSNASTASSHPSAGMSASNAGTTANAGSDNANAYGSSRSANAFSGNADVASMSPGEDRDTIRSVQQNLNDRGYDSGKVDGIMGPHTRAALKEFQQANGLANNGRLDEQTLAALGIEQSNPQQLVNQTAANDTSTSTANGNATASNTGSNSPGTPSPASSATRQ